MSSQKEKKIVHEWMHSLADNGFSLCLFITFVYFQTFIFTYLDMNNCNPHGSDIFDQHGQVPVFNIPVDRTQTRRKRISA